jgi:hypothetical protein
MSEDEAKPAKTKTTRGPVPTRLKIKGDWKDAVKASFKKKLPKRSSK